jgi:hypothetical protein
MTTEPQPKKHGCFFYGCIISLVIFVVVVGGFLFLGWYAVHRINALVAEYTDTQAVALPQDQLSPADLAAAKKRVADFTHALEAHTNTPPLVLSGPEINGLLASSTNTQQLAKWFHIDIQGDQIKGEVSLPLGEVAPDMPLLHLKDRYLNSDGVFTAVLTNGELSVHLVSADVRGKPLPDRIMTAISAQNLAQKATQDPKDAAEIGKFDSLEIKDGKVIITPKSP